MELPDRLLIEIGFIATEFAVIDQEMRLDLVHRRAAASGDQKWPTVPWGFGRMADAWAASLDHGVPADLQSEFERLKIQLRNRSDARNIALHGVWRELPDGTFKVVTVKDQADALHRETTPSTYAELREQAELVRELRYDLVVFLRRLHGAPDRDD